MMRLFVSILVLFISTASAVEIKITMPDPMEIVDLQVAGENYSASFTNEATAEYFQQGLHFTFSPFIGWGSGTIDNLDIIEIEQPASVIPDVSGSTIIWNDLFPTIGGQWSYQTHWRVFQKWLTLSAVARDALPSPTGVEFFPDSAHQWLVVASLSNFDYDGYLSADGIIFGATESVIANTIQVHDSTGTLLHTWAAPQTNNGATGVLVYAGDVGIINYVFDWESELVRSATGFDPVIVVNATPLVDGTYVLSDQPTTVKYTGDPTRFIIAVDNGGTTKYRIYVEADIEAIKTANSISSDFSITQATLELWTSFGSAARDISAYSVLDDFDPSTLTWNTQPTTVDTGYTISAGASTSTTETFSGAGIAEAMELNGGLMLRTTDETTPDFDKSYKSWQEPTIGQRGNLSLNFELVEVVVSATSALFGLSNLSSNDLSLVPDVYFPAGVISSGSLWAAAINYSGTTVLSVTTVNGIEGDYLDTTIPNTLTGDYIIHATVVGLLGTTVYDNRWRINFLSSGGAGAGATAQEIWEYLLSGLEAGDRLTDIDQTLSTLKTSTDDSFNKILRVNPEWDENATFYFAAETIDIATSADVPAISIPYRYAAAFSTTIDGASEYYVATYTTTNRKSWHQLPSAPLVWFASYGLGLN